MRSYMDRFTDLISGKTVNEAFRLYDQCRYLETRELGLKAIELFTYRDQDRVSFEPLNKAVDFVTRRVRALFLVLLGDTELSLGNMSQAGYYYHQAVDLAEEIHDLDTRAKAYQAMGSYYHRIGNLEGALHSTHKALDLVDGKKDPWGTRTRALGTLGVLYGDLGQSDKALAFTLEAVEKCYQENDTRSLPTCLSNLAGLYCGTEDYDPAIETLEQALEVSRQKDARHKEREALILNNLGMVYIKRSLSPLDRELGIKYLEQALQVSQEIGYRWTEALSTCNLGCELWKRGEIDEADEVLRKAVEIYRRIGSRSDLVDALTTLGLFLRDARGDLEAACSVCREAIELFEKLRGGLKKEVHRMSYSEGTTLPYDIMVDCLLRLHRVHEALEYVERSKSRALLELVVSKLGELDYRGPDPEAYQETLRLLREIDELRLTLEALQNGTESEEDGDGEERAGAVGYDDGYAESLVEELKEKETAFEEAFGRLNTIDPQAASLLHVVSLSGEDASKLIDEETVLIELYQTDKTLSMILVSRELPAIHSVLELDAPETLEEVWDLADAMRQKSALDTRSHDFIRNVKQPLTKFYDLLIAPLEPHLRHARRLIIIPHLFWHYLPFHALYNRKANRYLCDEFEIGYCPSATLLRMCREKKRHGRDRALILSRNDGDLPYVDKEADLIEAAFHPRGVTFKDDQAHFQRASEGNGPYDVVHLACHGRYNQEQPFLSSIDIPPDPTDQRKSYLLDLFRLKLDCNLVTLSACESGLSNFTSADELIGLSRGLFYAGAASVMLSLWQVADASTCYLMENFYWHYTKNRQSKTRALQLAMQAIKAKKETAHPYYWAPFVVMGDWR